MGAVFGKCLGQGKDKNGEQQHYEQYKDITNKQHRAKIRTMPIKHLVGKIFQLKTGYALSIREDMKPFVHNAAFIKQFDDVITYRALDYYRRRYAEK